MKKTLFFALFVLLFSCNSKKTDTEVWKIFQIGENDGGGPVWVETESTKTITFFEDGGVTIMNGDWCFIRDHDGSNTGILDSDNSTIQTTCYGNQSTISFSVSADGLLYLEYPGIEFSYESYKKVD